MCEHVRHRTISISHKKIYDSKRENAANQDDPGEEGAKGALRFRRQQHERFYIYIIYIKRRWLTWKRRSTTLAQNGPGLKAASNPQIIAFFLLTCWKTDATGKTQGQWWITFSGRSATEWPDAIAELHYNEKNGLNRSNAV